MATDKAVCQVLSMCRCARCARMWVVECSPLFLIVFKCESCEGESGWTRGQDKAKRRDNHQFELRLDKANGTDHDHATSDPEGVEGQCLGGGSKSSSATVISKVVGVLLAE